MYQNIRRRGLLIRFCPNRESAELPASPTWMRVVMKIAREGDFVGEEDGLA
jgi:hypothetical protein